MEKFDDTYIYVQSSNLVAEFYGNISGSYVLQNEKVSFDAYTESYDPDLPKENKTDLLFSFFCRRSCESWPEPNNNQTYTDWRVYNHSACDTVDGGSYSQKGCFNWVTSNVIGPSRILLSPTCSKTNL